MKTDEHISVLVRCSAKHKVQKLYIVWTRLKERFKSIIKRSWCRPKHVGGK